MKHVQNEHNCPERNCLQNPRDPVVPSQKVMCSALLCRLPLSGPVVPNLRFGTTGSYGIHNMFQNDFLGAFWISTSLPSQPRGGSPGRRHTQLCTGLPEVVLLYTCCAPALVSMLLHVAQTQLLTTHQTIKQQQQTRVMHYTVAPCKETFAHPDRKLRLIDLRN